jgi:hypothetical protein
MIGLYAQIKHSVAKKGDSDTNQLPTNAVKSQFYPSYIWGIKYAQTRTISQKDAKSSTILTCMDNYDEVIRAFDRDCGIQLPPDQFNNQNST